MKKISIGIFSLILIFMLSACGGNTGESSSDNGRDIVIASVAEPDSVDIHRTSSTSDHNTALYDTLMQLDKDGELQPGIIETYEVSDDDLSIEFVIRDDLEFHSGEPLNAEALKKSFERLSESSPFSDNAGEIEDIEIIDEYSLKITWEKPFAPIFGNLANPYLAPLDVSVLDEEGEGFDKNPSGSGPLKIDEVKRGDSILYEVNDDYDWGEEGPGFDTVKFRFIPDDETRILEFKQGNINVLQDVPYQYIDELEEDPEVTIERIPNYVMNYLGWNNKLPIFQDKNIRQAIALAIDRESIIENTLNGEAQPVFGPLPEATFGFNQEVEDLAHDKYQQDIDKAKELLAESGWDETNSDGVITKDGEEFSVDLWVDDDPANQRAAQIIQNQLKEIGIEISISVKESATIIEETPEGKHEMLLWSYGWLDADVLEFLLFGEGKSTRLHYENEDIYTLLEEGAVEMDTDKRMDIYEEAQKMLVEESPWVPLYVKENITATRGLDSFEMHPIRNVIMWKSVKVAD